MLDICRNKILKSIVCNHCIQLKTQKPQTTPERVVSASQVLLFK